MTYREDLHAEPHRFDFFAVMRELERSRPDKPKIGDSTITADDIVSLAQPPFLEFPDTNIASYRERPEKSPLVELRFLGFFGPQGALPITTSVEAYNWSRSQDPSFADFTNVLASRFLQLFFRAWADAHPIAQYDRPADDRFLTYVCSIAGIGTPAFRGRDGVDDIAKAGFAGLTGSKIKSASRLKRLVRGIFKVDTDIEERVGSWLTFEPGDRMALGTNGSALGEDSFIGARSYSINDKIRIKIEARDLEQYRRFLPSGDMSDDLTDLIFFYIGHRFEFDVELSIPARYAPPARLGVSGELGWTAWMSPRQDLGDDVRLRDARFAPLEIRRQAKSSRKSTSGPGPRGKRK